MKINRALSWRKRIKNLRSAIAIAPFLLLGGVRRVSRRQAGRFEVRRIEIPFPQLPFLWDGLTITHLSDLHIGPSFTVESHLPPVIAACRELNSDLVVMTGDWVDRHSHYLPEAIPLLRQLSASLGVFGCLGNHDIFDTRWDCVHTLRDWLGPNLLINSAVTMKRDSAQLVLAGIDYSRDQPHSRRHLATTRAQIPSADSFKVMLAHDPSLFPQLQRRGIDLVLSGHTHGGQISLTAEPHRMIGPMMFKFHYTRGLYREGNSVLYVNRGLGQSVPLRLNNRPEITQIRLVRETSGEPRRFQ